MAYSPRKLEGGIILGTGGDNSDYALGTFFEGAMTAGYASAATEDAIQANIVAAGYGKKSALSTMAAASPAARLSLMS